LWEKGWDSLEEKSVFLSFRLGITPSISKTSWRGKDTAFPLILSAMGRGNVEHYTDVLNTAKTRIRLLDVKNTSVRSQEKKLFAKGTDLSKINSRKKYSNTLRLNITLNWKLRSEDLERIFKREK
jgi:hypothetical protein